MLFLFVKTAAVTSASVFSSSSLPEGYSVLPCLCVNADGRQKQCPFCVANTAFIHTCSAVKSSDYLLKATLLRNWYFCDTVSPVFRGSLFKVELLLTTLYTAG